MRHAIAGLIAAGVITVTHAAQTQSPPWIGVWELDVTQSEYRAGSAPRRETIVISPYSGAYKITVFSTDTGGRASQTESVAKFNGTDVPAIGLRLPTTSAFTIVDERTFEIVDKVNGLVTLRRRAAVSADWLTLILTERGVDDGGQAVDAILHFVRTSASGTGIQPATPPGVVRAGSGVTLPRVLREVRPQYTAEAMRQKIQGTVLIECVVKTDGTVGDVEVLRSLDANYGLDQEAINAAKQWVFAPGTRNGEPVPVMVSIELTFVMGKD